MFTWLHGSSSQPPMLLGFRSSKTFIIITISTAIFTDIFVYALIVPVVPFALTSRAGIAPGSVQTWISILLAVYGAALLVASPFCGWLADRSSSRRMPLLLGLLALAGSTVMLCVGSSIGVLTGARVLQGVSAAVVWVVGLALLVDTVGSAEVGQAMGYVGISMSLAILLAPLLGGVVFAKAGYYAVFAMAFGLIAVDVVLRLVMIEKKIAVRWLDADVGVTKKEEISPAERSSQPAVEMATVTTPSQQVEGGRGSANEAKASSSSFDIEGGRNSTKDPIAEIGNDQAEKSPRQADEKTAHLDSIQTEKYPMPVNENPLIPTNTDLHWTSRLPPVIRLCSSRRLLSALWACLIQSTLLTSFDSTLPLFVKNTFHWDSTGAGLIFLPLVIVSFIGPVIGHLSDKYGPRWPATAGFVLGCPFMILLRLVDHDSTGQKALLCALLALEGASLTLVLTPTLAEMTYAVAGKEARYPPGHFGRNGAYAQAYSLLNMAWAAGCFVGPLLAGLVSEAHGWGTATLILGCISLFTALPTVIYTGGSVFKARRRKKEEAMMRTTRTGLSEEPA